MHQIDLRVLYDNMNSTETQEMDRDDEEGEVIYANADVIINNDGRTRVEDSDTKRLRILQNTGTDSSHYVKKYKHKERHFQSCKQNFETFL